jgi:hypothetical protein
MISTRARLLALGVALAAGFLSFGAKLDLVRGYGSDLPYMDEWDAVGGALLIPRAQGHLRAADFALPQNEHRIVLSRLVSYSLAALDGQWDPLLEMTVNALVHAALCAALVAFARRFASGLRFAGAAAAITLLFSLPFAFENTLQGLQSQFYFLEWGAFAMFVLCVPSAPLGARWWAGLLAGTASLGAMAPGFVASAVVLLLLLARCALNRRLTRRDALAAALLAALCVAGVLAISPVPGHRVLKARSLAAWVSGLATELSWPDLEWPLAFLILQLPIGILVIRCLRARRIAGGEAVLVALALWTWIQAAAIAYGRANFWLLRSPRFMDLYALGSVANLLALAALLGRGPFARARAYLGVLWVAMFAWGLWDQVRQAHALYLDDFPRLRALERQHVRSFLATGDLAALRSAPPHELPYPDPEILGGMLGAPGIRALLPLGVRPAVRLSADSGSSGFELADPGELPLEAGGRVWIARRGPARFVSGPLPGPLLPFMHVAVCGSPGLDASLLRLESAGGSEPDGAYPLKGPQWRASDVPVPRGQPVRVVVDVPAGDRWFAFSEPVGLGRGSWADRWLLRRSGSVLLLAAALYGALSAALLALDARQREWW